MAAVSIQCVSCKRWDIAAAIEDGGLCRDCFEDQRMGDAHPELPATCPPCLRCGIAGYERRIEGLCLDCIDALTAPDEEIVDSRPTVTAWSLHTLKGQPLLKLQCTGERHYKQGEVVSDEDYAHGLPAGEKWHKFRGTVQKAYVSLVGGAVAQHVEIAVQRHVLIESGEYKLRGIAKSEPATFVASTRTAAARLKPIQSQPAKPSKSRMMDLSQE